MINFTEVKLRAPEPEDANLIYIWENSTDESHSSLRTGPVSMHQIRNFIENYDAEIFTQGALRYMIDVEGETVGTIDVFDFDHHNRNAFVGIYITPNARQKGYGRKALKAVEKLMYHKAGIYSLAAIIAKDNKTSQRFFRNAGYNQVGELIGWIVDGTERINALLYQHIL